MPESQLSPAAESLRPLSCLVPASRYSRKAWWYIFFPQFFLLTTQLLCSQETQLSDLGSGVLHGKDTQLRTQASCVSQHPGKLKDTIFFSSITRWNLCLFTFFLGKFLISPTNKKSVMMTVVPGLLANEQVPPRVLLLGG